MKRLITILSTLFLSACAAFQMHYTETDLQVISCIEQTEIPTTHEVGSFVLLDGTCGSIVSGNSHSIKLTLPLGTIAVWHSHPSYFPDSNTVAAWAAPARFLSEADKEIARQLGIPVYVKYRNHITIYDPKINLTKRLK